MATVLVTATIAPSQKYNLTAIPEDANGNPKDANGNAFTLPGPLAWVLADTTLGTITPSPDVFALSCQFASSGKAGVAKITASDPLAPAIAAVEADITVALPLTAAVRLGLTGKVAS